MSFERESGESHEPRPSGAPLVELLFFEIGPTVYGADASQVRRIDRPSQDAIVLPALGTPAVGGRALIFATEDGERELLVDRVQGVQNAPLDLLRRMPPVARGHAFMVGMWLGADQPVLLIDLLKTASDQR